MARPHNDLFVEKKNGKYGTVNGFTGKLIIKDNTIESYNIGDYPRTYSKINGKNRASVYRTPLMTNFDDFISEVYRVINKQNLKSRGHP